MTHRFDAKDLLTSAGTFADVQTIGFPRALLYYRYHILWEAFFKELGIFCVTSPPTDRALCEVGSSLSVDECCLASKIYMGHVASLIGQCDAIFIPRIANLGERKIFCTKFESLPDLVRTVFLENEDLRIVTADISTMHEKRPGKAIIELAALLGKSPKSAAKAWKRARKTQKEHEDSLAEAQRQAIAKPGKKILLAAHPYVSHDPYLGGTVVKTIQELGATVLFADETDRKAAFECSFRYTATMPWLINREIMGAIILLEQLIDGVIVATSFPCGPDSMADDLIARRIDKVPLLQLTLDEQSGTAGLETRIESFLDIVSFRKSQRH